MPQFQIGNNGTLNIPPNTLDPVGKNGDIQYRTDTHRIRVHMAGVWKGISVEDFVTTGRYIYVDQDNTVAIDIRTGVSKYSIGVPFKTINAAIAAAVDNDIVYVQHSAVPYEGDVILDPLGYSGWTRMQLVLDNAVINGDVKCTQVNNQYAAVWGMGPQRGTVNGRISGLNNFQINYFANLTVTNGIYGTPNVDTLYDNCIVTWVDPLPRFVRGIVLNSRMVFNAAAADYSFTGTVIFDNCDLVFASSLLSYVQDNGDLHFENCRIRIGGSMLTDNRASNDGLRILIRNSRIAFGSSLLPMLSTSTYIFAAHGCQFISSTPGTAQIMPGTGATGNHFELITTVRNCPTGATPTVATNDTQSPSLTDF